MVHDNKMSQYLALSDWFQTALGEFVNTELGTHFELIELAFRGNVVLQLGNYGTRFKLKNSAFKHQWTVSNFKSSIPCSIICDFHQIPLKRQSVSCILAPLSLEPYSNGVQLIDEIDRLIEPMGYVVLICINPWSMWGIAMKMGLFNCYANANISMYSPLYLNKMFTQRGYKQLSLTNFCYRPPVSNKFLIKKMSFLDEIGKMLWPMPAGFYCYIAQKYQYVMPNKLIPSLIADNMDYIMI